MYKIEAAGAPPYHAPEMFVIGTPQFSAVYPWRLVPPANKADNQIDSWTFVSSDQKCWLIDRRLGDAQPGIETLVSLGNRC